MSENELRNFKVTLEYDGTGFHGWQVQPELRTVQGELFKAFAELGGKKGMKVTGAGRTDAGVHAAGQVASVRSRTRLDPATVKKALNAKLPSDMAVTSVEQVPMSFHARFDATARSYSYYLIRRRTALWRQRYHYVKGTLDIEAMRKALDSMRGERDFASFASSGDETTTVCRLMRAELLEIDPLVIISLKADRFLYNMVRRVAGTLLRIGRGSGEDVISIIEKRDNTAGGPVLPPHGLYLMKVDY